jgi:hypothetical protein
MTVTFDATSPAPGDQTANAVNGLTGFTTTGGLVTVGAGPEEGLILLVNLSLVTASSVAAVWDSGGSNQAMTLIGSQSFAGAGWAGIFVLVAPTSGNKNAKITWNNASSDIVVNGTCWTNVDQTGGATSFPNFASNTGTAPTAASVTVTSAVGDATEATVTTSGSPSAPTQTQLYLETNPTNESGAGSRAPGAASVTHQFSISGVSAWVMVGVSIKASSGRRFLMGRH